MKGLIIISGMCITCIPIFLFINYLFEHIKEKAPFDNHLKNMEEQNGKIGLFIAYITKISLSISVTTIGILMSSYFTNKIALKITITMSIIYIISQYFDKEYKKKLDK